MAPSRARPVPVLLGLGLLLAGCAGADRSGGPVAREPVFTPPSAAAASTNTRTVQGAPPLILDLVGSRLEERGFTVSHFDLDGGELVAEHHGDAMPYVDCGWIVLFEPDGTVRQAPGAAPSVELGDGTTRELELAARLLVRVFTDQEQRTRIRGEGTYVLIETTGAPGSANAQKDMAQFRSGSTGAFRDGAICRPTGELERLPGSLVPVI